MILIFQLEGQVVALLVHNLDRLDEGMKEESDGVHNTLGEFIDKNLYNSINIFALIQHFTLSKIRI